MDGFFENLNCSIIWEHQEHWTHGNFRINGTQRPEKDYSDISGIGVTIGFVVTALFCVVFSILHYLTSDPEGNPFDQLVLNNLHFPVSLLARKNRLRASFEKATKDLSDAQNLIGIALMLSGFFVLFAGTGTLSTYHWRYITSLATLSYCTTLSATIVIRSHLLQHFWRRIWKLSLMAILVLLLVVAGIPMSFQYIGSDPQWTYAVCGFYWQRMTSFIKHGRDQGGGSYYYVLDPMTAQTLLILSFLARVAKLSKHCQTLFIRMKRFINSIYSHLLGYFFSTSQRAYKPWLKRYCIYGLLLPLLAVRLTASIYADLVASALFEILCLVISTLWISVNLYVLHYYAYTVTGWGNIDLQWSFGQALSLFLLIVPLFGSTGRFFSSFHTSRYPPNTLSADLNTRSSNLEQGNEILQESLNSDEDSQLAAHEDSSDSPQIIDLPMGTDSIRTIQLIVPRSFCLLQFVWTWFRIQYMQTRTRGLEFLYAELYWNGFATLIIPLCSTYFVILLGLSLENVELIDPRRRERPIWLFIYWLTSSFVFTFYFLSPVWYGIATHPSSISWGFWEKLFSSYTSAQYWNGPISNLVITIIVFATFQVFYVVISVTSIKVDERRQELRLGNLDTGSA
ncbi:hypothetical protein F4781DRAFT_119768 [Annulohypoxylon bovei var. microspora]|nr:hypothetical protein F4781DRAFT_119768 [Annulohypoxylon bovei var. microspora]